VNFCLIEKSFKGAKISLNNVRFISFQGGEAYEVYNNNISV